MDTALAVPPEVDRLFAVSPVVLTRLRDIDYRVPEWGSVLVLPRDRAKAPLVRSIGSVPDDPTVVRVNMDRATHLARRVLVATDHVDPHEEPERHAASVGSILTPQYVLMFHSPATKDEVCHAVATMIAFEGKAVDHEGMKALVNQVANPVLLSLLSVLPVLQGA